MKNLNPGQQALWDAWMDAWFDQAILRMKARAKGEQG